ncbi:MAG: hypothetical protein K2Q18_05245 [Bdellovibrionales bacterium]|nr:hypothetical protein [Bdellovibrionales bacterium]
MQLFFLSAALLVFLSNPMSSTYASGTELQLLLNNSGKLQYFLSQELPKGTYKVWNMTTNQQVGANISKSDGDETFGKVEISEANKNDKFAILDSEGAVVFSLPGLNDVKVIDPKLDPLGIGQVKKASASQNIKLKTKVASAISNIPSSSNSSGSLVTVGVDQLSYIDKLIVAQKNQLAGIEELSRKSKMKIQRMLKKSFDCQKEIDAKNKLSPETEIFCKKTAELALAYQKAEDQLKTTTKIKIQTLESVSPNSAAVTTATQIAAKNLELPTNLDPKSLQIPAQTTTKQDMVPGATGSWGLAQRFYDVAEYSICLCGSSTAQVPGKTCPENSSQTGYYNFGPYYLNNAGTKCDLNSNPPYVKYVTDDYTPSTLTTGVKAIHGKDVVAQARALRESGEINKLSGPEAMEFLVELNQVLSTTANFKEGEPVKLEAGAMGEIWAKYAKDLEVKQAKTRDSILNVPPKIYGDLKFKFLNLELEENRVPKNTFAVVPITEPVSLSGGIAEVRLVGGFWGQHGWEVSTDKKNFSKIETPVTIKDGDVIYLRGQSVDSYNHGFGIEVAVSAKTVNGSPNGQVQFVFLKNEDGCNADGIIQWDTEINLAPTKFPNGQNEKCYTLPGVFGEIEKGKTDVWKFGQGIVSYAPMKPTGSETSIDCTELHRLAGRETLYKIPHTNPFNGKPEDFYPVTHCKVSGNIKYVCKKGGSWLPAENAGFCELR